MSAALDQRSGMTAEASLRRWFAIEEQLARRLEAGGLDRAALLKMLDAHALEIVRGARAVGAQVRDRSQCASALRWLTRPVFLCGHHRSGTTLLQSLLDGHPELLVLPSEGTYFTSLRYAARARPGAAALERFVAEWVCRLIDPNEQPHFKLGRSGANRNPYFAFAKALLDWQATLVGAHGRWAQLFALAAAYREVHDPTSTPNRWVEKTPLNELHTRRLMELRGAVCIQVVRDPRATLASLRRAYAKADLQFDPPRHASAIGHSLQLAHRHSRRYAGRYHLVHYEALAENPALELRRITDFLELAPLTSTPVASIAGIPVAANSSFKTSAPGSVTLPTRHSLPAEEELMARAFTGTSARKIGYGLDGVSLLTELRLRMRHQPRILVHDSAASLLRLLSQ